MWKKSPDPVCVNTCTTLNVKQMHIAVLGDQIRNRVLLWNLEKTTIEIYSHVYSLSFIISAHENNLWNQFLCLFSLAHFYSDEYNHWKHQYFRKISLYAEQPTNTKKRRKKTIWQIFFSGIQPLRSILPGPLMRQSITDSFRG